MLHLSTGFFNHGFAGGGEMHYRAVSVDIIHFYRDNGTSNLNIHGGLLGRIVSW